MNSSAFDVLNKCLDELEHKEIIDGACPADCRDMVDLDIAFSPVLYRPAPERRIAKPDIVIKQDNGIYRIDWPERVDFEFVSAESLRLMRARFLLWHGYFYRMFDTFSHRDQQNILAWYFPQGMVRWASAGGEIAGARRACLPLEPIP